MDRGAWWAAVHGVAKSQTRLSHVTYTFHFHFHALEKEMATHSGVLAWRIRGMEESGGLPSMGSHRVGHDWSDLAAAAAAHYWAVHCLITAFRREIDLPFSLCQCTDAFYMSAFFSFHTVHGDLPLEKPVCRSGSSSQKWTWNNRLLPNRKRSTSRLYIVTLII